jgi:hypothetical protein
MNRRKLLKGMTGLALAEYLGALNAAFAAGGKLPPPGMHRLSGKVEVNGRPATQGMAISAGDTITTGSDGEAIYVIGNDAYLQRDRSTVTLTSNALTKGLRVLNGKLLSVFGKGTKQIETSTATIGIRGTGCYIEAEPNKVYFCLCYGIADIASLKDPTHTETIETRYHDHPVYLHADGTQMMVPADVINHSDSELILLESLVGRLPPFYGASGGYGKY